MKQAALHTCFFLSSSYWTDTDWRTDRHRHQQYPPPHTHTLSAKGYKAGSGTCNSYDAIAWCNNCNATEIPQPWTDTAFLWLGVRCINHNATDLELMLHHYGLVPHALTILQQVPQSWTDAALLWLGVRCINHKATEISQSWTDAALQWLGARFINHTATEITQSWIVAASQWLSARLHWK